MYVPNSRSQGSFARIIRDMSQYGPVLIGPLDTCDLPTDELLCHFYLPPCGNATHFQPPTSVCPDVCNAIRHHCPEQWATVVDYYKQAGPIITSEGLEFIECNFPGKHLAPLPHCCSDIGLNISKSESTPYISIHIIVNFIGHAHQHIMDHLLSI